MKKCSECCEELELTEYFKLKGSKDGYMKLCKSCYNEKYLTDVYVDTKVCTNCEVELSLNNFHRDMNQSDGRKPVCKECSKKLWNGGNKFIGLEDSKLPEDEIQVTRHILQTLGYELDNPDNPIYKQFRNKYNFK